MTEKISFEKIPSKSRDENDASFKKRRSESLNLVNEVMESFCRQVQIKERNSQILAANMVLNS